MNEKSIEELIVLLNEILVDEDFELKYEKYEADGKTYFKVFEESPDGLTVRNLMNEWDSHLIQWFLRGILEGVSYERRRNLD
ncbi:MAG: hypothetical protein KAS32_05770 [Candidatus Peribacteraceae bacterium]|nr:hypothetical protein [Candidatus Peribacteraceae bacterium]